MVIRERMMIVERMINDMLQSLDVTNPDMSQIEMLEEELYEMKTVVSWLNNEWNAKKKTYVEDGVQYVKLINWTPFNFRFVRLHLDLIHLDGKRDVVIAETGEWPARSERKMYFDKLFPDGVQLKGEVEMVEFEIER